MRNVKDNTALSAHVWDLEDKDSNFNIKWDFLETAHFNRRQEIFNTCRHRKQRLLAIFRIYILFEPLFPNPITPEDCNFMLVI